MKYIGIDARLLFQTGVGTYLQNLLHYIPDYAPSHITFTFFCLPQDASFIKKEVPNSRIRTITALWHSWGEQTTFLKTIQKDNLDLMHFTYFGHPIFYNRPFISTIHDVTPLLFSTGKASTKNALFYAIKHCAFSVVLGHQVYNSKAIITPTYTVKEQLVRIYGDHVGHKITPIHEGISYRLFTQKNEENEIPKPYLLYVGNFYPHKNVKLLISAFAKCNSSYSLVLAGPHDYFLKRLLQTLSLEEKRHLIVKDRQSLCELVSLYKHAEALIHPSISEGFGLPLVEAMHFGIPIIASHIPVFQELLGTSYYSFDPYEESSIGRAIHTFEDEEIKKKNSLRNDFSFTEMVKKTMDLYMKNV
ncbi:MAG: glycosyltransferase family 1 protein [bacterium]